MFYASFNMEPRLKLNKKSLSMGDQWRWLGYEILQNNFTSTWNHTWNETKMF